VRQGAAGPSRRHDAREHALKRFLAFVAAKLSDGVEEALILIRVGLFGVY
jgi:hypothetical protein